MQLSHSRYLELTSAKGDCLVSHECWMNVAIVMARVLTSERPNAWTTGHELPTDALHGCCHKLCAGSTPLVLILQMPSEVLMYQCTLCSPSPPTPCSEIIKPYPFPLRQFAKLWGAIGEEQWAGYLFCTQNVGLHLMQLYFIHVADIQQRQLFLLWAVTPILVLLKAKGTCHKPLLFMNSHLFLLTTQFNSWDCAKHYWLNKLLVSHRSEVCLGQIHAGDCFSLNHCYLNFQTVSRSTPGGRQRNPLAENISTELALFWGHHRTPMTQRQKSKLNADKLYTYVPLCM